MDAYKFVINNTFYQKKFIEFLVDLNYKINRDNRYSLDESNCFIFWADGRKVTLFTKCENAMDAIQIRTEDELKDIIKRFKYEQNR